MRAAQRVFQFVELLTVRAVRPRHRPGRVAAVVLADSAGFGRLWVAIAAVLGLTGGDRRRAALHGSLGWAAGEVAAAGVKQVVRRRRPSLRSLGHGVRTSSFPSAHAAAAAGFAAAATTTHPPVAGIVVPVAVAVCWSRVATARHFMTDVAAGVAVGAATGVVVSKLAQRVTERLTSDEQRPT
jgi:membrane-associated phospholipid phosphatase